MFFYLKAVDNASRSQSRCKIGRINFVRRASYPQVSQLSTALLQSFRFFS
jgi:hypothetical protein